MKIITHYDPKPIPIRSFDWSAVTDEYDAGDPTGFGATEIEAIADLREWLPCKGEQPSVGWNGDCLRCGAAAGESCLELHPPTPSQETE